VRHVVLSSPFGLIHNDVFTRDGEVEPAPVRLDFVAQALIDTVRRIKALGPSVTVVAPTPGDGRDIGRCLVRVRMFDLPDDNCDFSLDDLTGKIKRSYRLMDIIAREAPVMRMEKLICPDGRCRAMQDGVFIYRDARHLSVEGAAYLALKRAFVDRMLRPGEVPIR